MTKFQKLVLASLAGIALLMVASVVYLRATDERGKHDVATNYYHGTLQTATGNYDVFIDENDRGYGFDKIVHLRPVDAPSYEGITGHDYENHGKWDRVFYCGENGIAGQGPATGCNAVVRTNSGWRFEPCDGDKGKVKPFTQEAIHYATTQLDNAMLKVYNREHITQQWRWDAKQKKVIQIYKKS